MEWISVKDRLPEHGNNVLGYCIYDACEEHDVVWWDEDEKKWREELSDTIVRPSHWMPLPPPPKDL